MLLVKRRLRFLLPFIISIFTLLVMFISFFASHSLILQSTEQDMLRNMRDELSNTQGVLEQFLSMGEVNSVLQVVSVFGTYPATKVMLATDYNNKVIASTNYQDIEQDWQSLSYDIRPKIVEHIDTARNTELEVDKERQYLNGYSSLCPPTSGNTLRTLKCGFIYYQVDLSHYQKSALESLLFQTRLTGFGILASAILLLTILHFLLTRRAGRLVATAAAYQRGNRNIRSRLQGSDELAQIGQAIDGMLDTIIEDESKIRARESRLLAIFNAVADPVIIANDKGIILRFNASAEKIFGYSADEAIGNNISILMPEPYRSAHDGFLQHFHQRGKIDNKILGKSREILGVRKNGEQFPVEVTITSLQEDDQILLIGLIRDISDRKEAEENLRLAKKVFENTNEAIIITDENACIIDVNPAYEKLTGYSREEVVGSTPSISSSKRHNAEFYRSMWHDIYVSGTWCGEIWDRRKNGEVFPNLLTVNAIKNSFNRVTHYVGIFTDITHQKNTEQKLEQLAYYDPLTGLPNRLLFKDRLSQAIAFSRRNKTRMALMFIDLDRFKNVNDTLGHDIGDMLLVEVAERISSCLRKTDTVSRLGGDEFTAILPDIEHEQDISHLAQNIIDKLHHIFRISGHEFYIGASIGIAISPDDGSSIKTLTKNADIAMYQAKDSGKGTYKFFTQAFNDSNKQRLHIEQQLHKAIKEGQLILYYQPKVELNSGIMESMEALIRWQHPEEGMISPDSFIPIAEETNLIQQIDEWVIKTSLQQIKQWQQEGLGLQRVAINLSARKFQQPNLTRTIQNLLNKYELPPEVLELEIPERTIMKDAEAATKVLQQLKEMGLKISIDDFGTGYSSLSYLKKFPIHTLKIDHSFIKDLSTDPDDKAITASIIAMAKSLNLEVLAEGVETEDHRTILKEMGCTLAQGYLFSRPLPADQLAEYLGMNSAQNYQSLS